MSVWGAVAVRNLAVIHQADTRCYQGVILCLQPKQTEGDFGGWLHAVQVMAALPRDEQTVCKVSPPPKAGTGEKTMWLFFNSGRDHTMIFFMGFQFWEQWKSIRSARNIGKQRAACVNLTLDGTMQAKAAFIRFLLCSWENWEQFCKQNPKCGICRGCGLHLLK